MGEVTTVTKRERGCPMCHAPSAMSVYCPRCHYEFGQPVELTLQRLRARRIGEIFAVVGFGIALAGFVGLAIATNGGIASLVLATAFGTGLGKVGVRLYRTQVSIRSLAKLRVQLPKATLRNG